MTDPTTHEPAPTSVDDNVASQRWEWTAIILVAIGLVTVLIATFLPASSDNELGVGQIATFVGIGIAALGLIWFRRSLSKAEKDFIAERSELKTLKTEVEEEQKEFDAARRVLENELQQQLARIEQRGKSVADRMIAFHEWMEFPQPIELRDAESDHADLQQKDRQVLAIMEEESKRLYERIRNNEFRTNGKFDSLILRDEILELCRKVAKVYRPEIEDPLLETSAEQLLRALSRASLHLLIVFDQLPLDVKKYNINRVYDYIRKAIQAYGAYKAASPYLTGLSRTIHVGRMATAANPVTWGAWWGISELGKIGAKKLAERFINQQAVNLLHDAVRVIGYEVATIYGEDFRHRDANWIYGVELTELLVQFPTSREAVVHGLNEVGRLPLRNEYDRIFLYRCIASRKSAGVMKAEKMMLSSDERNQVAHRLESALQSVIHGQTDDSVSKWKKGVEIRLGVQVRTNLSNQEVREAHRLEAARSLLIFLCSAQPVEKTTALNAIQNSSSWKVLPTERQQELLVEFHNESPQEFYPPEFDPDSDDANRFLNDLVGLSIEILEFDTQVELAIGEVGTYFRQSPEQTEKRIGEAFQKKLAAQLSETSPVKQPTPEVSRAVLMSCDKLETVNVIYNDVDLMNSKEKKVSLGNRDVKLTLAGTETRWLLVADLPTPSIIWESDKSVNWQTVSGYLANSVRLVGGRFHQEVPADEATIVVPGVMTSRFETYFAPLVEAFTEKQPA